MSSNWFAALLADLRGELRGTEAEQHLGPALLGRAGAGRGIAPRGRWEGTSWARWPHDLAHFFFSPCDHFILATCKFSEENYVSVCVATKGIPPGI